MSWGARSRGASLSCQTASVPLGARRSSGASGGPPERLAFLYSGFLSPSLPQGPGEEVAFGNSSLKDLAISSRWTLDLNLEPGAGPHP